jgi:hypothetical protein
MLRTGHKSVKQNLSADELIEMLLALLRGLRLGNANLFSLDDRVGSITSGRMSKSIARSRGST